MGNRSLFLFSSQILEVLEINDWTLYRCVDNKWHFFVRNDGKSGINFIFKDVVDSRPREVWAEFKLYNFADGVFVCLVTR